MSYANWSDVEPYLDANALAHDDGNLELDRLQQYIADEEKVLDTAIRRFIDVPVDETESPECYALAKEIVSKRVAARYIRWVYAAEGRAEQTWAADRLDADAQSLILALQQRAQPPDAQAPSDPLSYIPYSGEAPTDTTDSDPAFKRSHLPGRSDPW